MTEWNESQRRVERRSLTPEVVEARIACRVAELRVLAARTSILAARAHVPSDIWFASKADVARAIVTAIAKRKQRRVRGLRVLAAWTSVLAERAEAQRRVPRWRGPTSGR